VGPGRTLAGIPVRIARFNDPGDDPELPNWFEIETDAAGDFRVGDLPPGRYGLRLRPEGLAATKLSFTVPREGGEVRLEDIVYAPGGSILIQVRDSRRRPMAGERVGISAGPGPPRHGRTSNSGEVRFDDLPEGSYILEWDLGRGTDRRALSASVVAGEVAVVEFGGRAGLTGRLFAGDGARLSRAIVRLVRASEDPRDYGRAQTETNGVGEFRFEGLATGVYRVRVQILQGARCVVPAGTLTVGEGDLAPCEIRLANTRLEGRVVEEATGKPLSWGEVAVSALAASEDPVESWGLRSFAAYPDEEGCFTYLGLPPGAWVISVKRRGSTGTGVSQRVTIPASGTGEEIQIEIE
jgi:hypothetical protein